MAITHKEKTSSRKGHVKFNDPSATLEFWIHGTSGDAALVAYANNLLPATYTVNGVTMWFDMYTYEYHGNLVWTVIATYKKSGNSIEVTVKSGSGHAKKYQSFATIESYECTGDVLLPPDFKKAINVSEHGAEGVDCPFRKFEFSIAKKFSIGSLRGDYVMNLWSLQNKTNADSYTLSFNGMTITFNRGTLVFHAFPFKMTSDSMLDITYEFSAEEGIDESDNFTIGESRAISKKGQEYLWVHYKDKPDTDNTGYTIKQPIGAYVEQVFEYADFSQLVI